MASESRDAVDYHADSAVSDQRNYQRDQLRNGIEHAGRLLSDESDMAYRECLHILTQVIFPALRRYASQDLDAYDALLAEDVTWDWQAVQKVRRRPEHVGQQLVEGHPGAKQTIRQALKSATSAAAFEGLVLEDYTNRADAVGETVSLGIQIKRADMDFGDPVRIITNEQGELKHFIGGNTGTGKTTAASRHFEDAYRRNFQPGGRRKCLDYVGLGKAENVTYDLPMMYNDLRHVRTNNDLPEDFRGLDSYKPDQEVLVPLTKDLPDTKLPHRVDTGEPVPIPFVIPASDISEGLLASVIDAQVSDSVEMVVRDAYAAVDRRISDWSLADLAEEIKSRDELSDKEVKSAVRILRRLQSMGFIRTHDHEYALDWDRLFTSTDTITTFSQQVCDDEFEQLIIVAYLLDRHWTLRRQNDTYPAATIWLRELWEIAEHEYRRRKRDDREQAVMEHIIHRLSRMVRKNRDIKTEILADTQNPTDVDKGVRMLFNRYVIFNSSDELLKEVFSYTANSDWRSAKRTLSERTGEGAVIGACEPAVSDSDRWGVSPVRFYPPSWHVHDKDRDDSGWRARVKYTEQLENWPTEELQTPSWDVRVPEKLRIGAGVAEEDEEDDSPDHKDLHRAEARNRRSNGESVRDIREAIPNNPETGKPYSLYTIQNWTEDIYNEMVEERANDLE